MEVFIASIYRYIYILAVAFVTLHYLPIYQTQTAFGNNQGKSYYGNGLAFLIIVILFIGIRPINEQYFNDMAAYSYWIRLHAGSTFVFNKETDNKIFDNFILWFGSNNFDQRFFFIIMSALYFGCMYLGLKRLFPNNIKLAFLTYLAGFSTFAYAVNGMKAGVAASIFILALSFKDKKIICALLMMVSLGFHHSMILPIVACVLVYVFKNAKWYYRFWLLSLIVCALHITYFQEVFAGFSDEQGASYLNATSETTSAYIGFRPDFILYSAMPVLLGYKYEINTGQKLSSTYQFLMHFYLLTNAVWMLCMYASFNNRIAYLSWFVYPIVIIAPFLDKMNKDPQRYVKLSRVVKYHLFFTMFMVFIYYGLFSFGR